MTPPLRTRLDDGPRDARDAAWAAQIRTGDVGAFDALYLSYHQPLWAFAYRFVRSREAAEDLVQDVFQSLWEQRATWYVQGSVRVYLFGAVRNRALNHLRHRDVVQQMEREEATSAIGIVGSSPRTPDQVFSERELCAAVQAAVADLPEHRRRVVMLRLAYQMPYAEVAAILGISVDAARAEVSRAYKTLRGVLRAFEPD